MGILWCSLTLRVLDLRRSPLLVSFDRDLELHGRRGCRDGSHDGELGSGEHGSGNSRYGDDPRIRYATASSSATFASTITALPARSL